MERISLIEHLKRARDIGQIVLLGLLDRVDTRYADALNGPEEWPRIHIDHVEAPAATEEELSLPRHDTEATT